jgi:hypothetical protein
MNEPLPPSRVRGLVVVILERGVLAFSRHAYDEMRKDNLTEVDVRNTLRGGAASPGEYENGSWRYRISTARSCVVISFRDELRAVVVTAWRIKK